MRCAVRSLHIVVYTSPHIRYSGLADTLRSELLLYNIDVQIYSPATLFTPGYEEENKTKPAITLKIEEGDPGQTPEQAAAAMLKGDTSS